MTKKTNPEKLEILTRVFQVSLTLKLTGKSYKNGVQLITKNYHGNVPNC